MKYIVMAILILLLVAACTQGQKQQTEPVGSETKLASSTTSATADATPVKAGCYFVKHVRADVYNCFGCSKGVCRQPDQKEWVPTKQDIPNARGYRCVASQIGCVLE